MTAESTIASALAEVILTGTAITPRTTVATVAGAAAAGNSYVDVDDASAFVMQGTARFWDALGDEEIGIATVDTTVTPHRIHLETPLAATHAAGTIVSTNLLDYAPEELGTMVVTGQPVVFIAPVRTRLDIKAQGVVRGPMRFQVQVNLLDEQRTSPTIHPNVWTRRQQHASSQLLDQIIGAVLANRHLNVSSGTYAQGIGTEGDPVAEKAFGRFVTRDNNVPVFAAATHIVVRPRAMTFTP